MEKTFSFATLMHNHYFQDPEPHPKEVENEEAVSDSLHHTDMELIAVHLSLVHRDECMQ